MVGALECPCMGRVFVRFWSIISLTENVSLRPKKRPLTASNFQQRRHFWNGDRGLLTGSAWLVVDTDGKRRR